MRKAWQSALADDRFRLSPIARIEFLITARDGASFDTLSSALDDWRIAPLSRSVMRAAETAMTRLTHRSAGAHRLPIADYVLAASAQELGAAVLHYDRDFDTLAELLDFESVWIAEPGTLS